MATLIRFIAPRVWTRADSSEGFKPLKTVRDLTNTTVEFFAMLERQYREDDSFANLVGFRPIVLYDTRGDVVDESLTLSTSARDRQLPQFSSHELDEIDSPCVSLQDSQQAKTPNVPKQQHYSPPPSSRSRGYADGDELFNYRALGSLRSGLAPISLLSWWHVGLAVTAFSSGATLAFMRAAYRPHLLRILNDRFHKRYDASTSLIDWPDVFSVVLGLFSDCVPIYGTRRKAYIVLGWIFSAVSYASGCLIYLLQIRGVEEPDAIFGALLQAFSIIGCFALQLSWVVALALVVGFGQRETLGERGDLATRFLVIWKAGSLVAHVAVAELQSMLTLSSSGAVLAVASVVSLPFVLWFLHDDDEREYPVTLVASTKRAGVVSALRIGIVQLWEICQEKVTYRVLFFLLIYGALLKASDPGVDETLAVWSGFTSFEGSYRVTDPWLLVVQSGVAVTALLHAKWRLLSIAWRPLAFTATGIVVVGTLVQSIIVATDTVRTKWLFSLLMGVIVWPETWILLFMVLSITEVADVGCEGITMGIMVSFQGLGTAATRAITRWISHSAHTSFNRDQIERDLQSTRTRVMYVAAAYAVLNLFAAATVPWLPRNKLETQQLRAFGGYSKRGAALTVLVFALLLALVLVANLKTV
ncbi:hypothetical protein BBO99_00004241 [Phytophthora kernoviae]|uniref:Transmembrane protein n=2 Tax=Phytophthora kernoviae TaxID=325452 RepID=A0A3R7GTA6_9STRA|nr:hypothetical protein G195_005819 [Phytophthora kernoviae 00238/432]KAG2522941.1 hypothetical protein JM16_005584 [Phytophthora kernoviae]KAG2524557.1 hypothetical protein JM18_005320 [Phytophthora kernoviae]RLN38002.1 hypothetical protein BBI17_002311 [Phytophthora kernoviae]RLN80780.1 hypothetical protein BBO99_00004241 [Phytophthora kernoviae]